MKLIEKQVIEFVNEVDSKSPAPGGGSVAALAGALSTALSNMVLHLTVSKKKFQEVEASIQTQIHKTMSLLEESKNQFLTLVDKDTEAFNEIMAAFKLPKETDEEKKSRSLEIQKATISAVEVPKQVATLSKEMMEHIKFLSIHGNQNCLSDAGVSALLLHTALMGAVMNMKINVSSLKDEAVRENYLKEIDAFITFSNQEILPFITNVTNKL